jgi:hypothetical protein
MASSEWQRQLLPFVQMRLQQQSFTTGAIFDLIHMG